MPQTITLGGAGTVGGSTSLTPAPVKGLANTNYLSNADYTFAQQYLPDLYEKEFDLIANYQSKFQSKITTENWQEIRKISSFKFSPNL